MAKQQNQNPFEVGDKVRHKSGTGPEMIVSATGGDVGTLMLIMHGFRKIVVCEWFEEKKFNREWFYPETLEKIAPEPDSSQPPKIPTA